MIPALALDTIAPTGENLRQLLRTRNKIVWTKEVTSENGIHESGFNLNKENSLRLFYISRLF